MPVKPGLRMCVYDGESAILLGHVNFETPIGYSKQLSNRWLNICLELKVGLRTVVQIWEGYGFGSLGIAEITQA